MFLLMTMLLHAALFIHSFSFSKCIHTTHRAPTHGHLPAVPSTEATLLLADGQGDDRTPKKHDKQKKKHKKHKKKKKKSSKKKKKNSTSSSESSSEDEGRGQVAGAQVAGHTSSVHVLRQERMAREAAERARQQAAVHDSLAAAGVPLSGGRYHNSYGNAAQLPPLHKRSRP